MISSSLNIEKCLNCGHDIMASGELVKHTNTKDGHRFFTKFCQECDCSEPAQLTEKKELQVSFPKKKGKTRAEIEKLLGEGKTNREISKILDMASSSVSYHVGAIKAAAAKASGGHETGDAGVNGTAKDQTKEADAEQEKPPILPSPEPGILKSRIEVENCDGYSDVQKQLISESVRQEIYHAGKGKAITMEVRKLPDRTRVVVEITGEDAL